VTLVARSPRLHALTQNCDICQCRP